jgi:hypothetical protein
VNDYDTWQHWFDPETNYFKLGMDSYPNNPCSEIWKALIQGEHLYKQILDGGKAIYDYSRSELENYRQDYGYETEFEGYVCYAVNRRANSWIFGKLYDEKKYPMYVTYGYNGDVWTFTLFSPYDDMDVSKIARKYKGGGHKHAAGFQLKKLPVEFGGTA